MAIAMFLALPAVGAGAAEPDPLVTFDGAGWGHGVGMSQYGAYGRAIEGQEYDTILEAYYTGSSIAMMGADVVDPGAILTNVVSDLTSEEGPEGALLPATVLTVLDGPATPRTGMTATRLTGEETPPSVTLFTGDSISIVDETPDAGNPNGCVMTLMISASPPCGSRERVTFQSS